MEKNAFFYIENLELNFSKKIKYNEYMNSPLVSVVIPSFNRLDYLLRAIESVLNQTYSKTEIIVVNDGSTEEGYLEHKYIKDIKQINLEQNQKNINGFGPGNIRNFGINKASGEWIAFLDDDDLWLKDKLEIQLNHLKGTDLKDVINRCINW